jgi:hypothetical protein
MPKDFFVDLCRVLISGRRGLQPELRDCCNFHVHCNGLEHRRCRERQVKDGAFYASLLRVCVETEIRVHEELEKVWKGLRRGGMKREAICMI